MQEGVGGQGLQLVVIAQHRQRAATLRDPALELAVLVMHGAEAEIRGPGTDPQEAEVEAELFGRLGRRDINGPADQRILLATEEDGPDAGSLQQPAGDGRAVGHHRQALVLRHEGCQQQVGAAGIQEDQLVRFDQAQGGHGQGLLLRHMLGTALGQGPRLGRQGDGATVDALAAPLIGQIAQIPPDGRLRGAQRLRQLRRHHFVVRGQQIQNEEPSLLR